MLHILALLLALSALSLAQDDLPAIGYDISAPFRLKVSSRTNSLDGLYLVACHEGAAIESLCVLPDYPSSSFFQLNTSYYESSPPDYNVTSGVPGTLFWNLTLEVGTDGEEEFVPQIIRLGGRGPSSNMRFATIFFADDEYGGYGDGVGIAFDNKDMMNIQDVVLTNVSANYFPSQTVETFYRWYICANIWNTYYYYHLMWMYGSGDPSERGCKAVSVKRVFL